MKCALYVITDEKIAGGRSHEEIARLALRGGADIIQLRDKERSLRELTRTGRKIAAMTRRAGSLFIVNDRLDIAIACGADGVHLGQSDMRAGTARQLAPPGFIIGVSVGSVREALEAEADGVDHVVLSPVFRTSSKEDAGPGHGLERLREIRSRVSIPVLAIGGITRENAAKVISAGADGIAVVSAIVARPDIEGAARELGDLVRSSLRERNQRSGS